jgi:hypothetical protein
VADFDDALDPSGEVDEEIVDLHVRRQFHRPRWFHATDDGGFEVGLPASGRLIVGRMVADLRELLLVEDESLRRLYPTAYPDDEVRNEEFAAMAHDQLLMARLEGLDVVERTLDAEVLTAAELTAWMQVVNEARLVLGTTLDVIEDDPRDDDPDHPDAGGLALFRQLGYMIGDMVDALHGTLPVVPVEDELDGDAG